MVVGVHRFVIVKGNPADAPMLAPAIRRFKTRFGRAPGAVTADRGYGEAKVDAELETLGVRTVAIPRRGRPGAARQQVQRGRGFVKLVKWRTGCEGRISTVNRDWGWARTLMDGEIGAQTWCGWGLLPHNSVKVARLVDAKDRPATPGPLPEPSRPAGARTPNRSLVSTKSRMNPGVLALPARRDGPEGPKGRVGRSQNDRTEAHTLGSAGWSTLSL